MANDRFKVLATSLLNRQQTLIRAAKITQKPGNSTLADIINARRFLKNPSATLS